MSKRVLIIDDSPTIRQQVRLTLTKAGFDVVEAVDGVEGKDRIGADGAIAVVICDVNMPRMNGIDLVRAVKSDPSYAQLPIVMLTTEAKPELMQKAKSYGAKAWIVKPFKPELLTAAVNKLAAA